MTVTLVTKDGRTPVELTDVICIAVMPGIARPTVFSRAPGFRVSYWDPVIHKRSYKKFATREEADAFCPTVELSEDQRRRYIKIADILSDKKFTYQYYRLALRPQEFEAQPVPVDPMLLGLWLGDGSSRQMQIATADEEILNYMRHIASQYEGMHVYHSNKYNYAMSMSEKGVRSRGRNTADPDTIDAALKDLDSGALVGRVAEAYGTDVFTLRKYQALSRAGKLQEYRDSLAPNPIASALKSLGVWGNKHIPEVYLKNSRECRLALLAGIIDTDGYLHLGGYDMCFASKRLTDDVARLARSLGFRCLDGKHCKRTCTNAPGGPKEFDAYRTRICGGPDLMEIPLLLERRKIRSAGRHGGELPFKLEVS